MTGLIEAADGGHPARSDYHLRQNMKNESNLQSWLKPGARVLLNFFRQECCGKCTPCRIGTQRAYEILTNLAEGTAQLSDLDYLQKLSESLAQYSNCGLGQTAGVPIRDILKYFRAEVEAHVRLKICPAGACLMKVQQV